MKKSLNQAQAGLEAFLADPTVSVAAKEIIEREYPPGTALFETFVVHSYLVAKLACELARSSGADVTFVYEAAWLHDIGIKYTDAPGINCVGSEPYLRHGVIGRALCDEAGLPRHGLVCERHVGTGLSAQEIERDGLPLPIRDMLCESLEEKVVCYADLFYSKSSAERFTFERVIERIDRHGPGSRARFEEMRALFRVDEERL